MVDDDDVKDGGEYSGETLRLDNPNRIRIGCCCCG